MKFIKSVLVFVLYSTARSLNHRVLRLIISERNVISLLFSGEVESGHCDVLLRLEKEGRLDILQVYFL